MGKYYTRVPILVEALTFDEFVKYGIEHAENLVNGEPWSFRYHGLQVTQENSEMYLIPSPRVGEGFFKFTPIHLIVTQPDGSVEVVRIEEFEKQYGFIEASTPFVDFVNSTPDQLAEKLLKASCCYCIYGKDGELNCNNTKGAHCKEGILAYLTGKTLD